MKKIILAMLLVAADYRRRSNRGRARPTCAADPHARPTRAVSGRAPETSPEKRDQRPGGI